MDLEASTLFASMVVSTAGFSVFLFGKKQKRLPQILGGVLMMGGSVFVGNAAGIYVLGAVASVATWAAVRLGL